MYLTTAELKLLKELLSKHSEIEQEYKSMWIHKAHITDPLLKKIANEYDKQSETETTGDTLIEDICEDFKNQCEWWVDGDECILNNNPNLREIINEHLAEYKDNKYFEDIKEYVYINICSEDALIDHARECYIEDYYDDNPY